MPQHPTQDNGESSSKLIALLTKPLTGAILAIIGLLLGVVFWWWPHSSSTPSFQSVAGGPDPTPFFGSSSSSEISATNLILFSQTTADKYGDVSEMGSLLRTVCSESHANPKYPGIYRCVSITPAGNPVWAADPCFAVSTHQVECAMSSGGIFRFKVSEPQTLTEYVSNIGNIGHSYPWHLKLSDGLLCNWDWWDEKGPNGPYWACSGTSGGPIEIIPNNYGANPLNYTSILSVDTGNAYLATSLDQSSQNSWTILVEKYDDKGIYERVTVTQAWY
jgi:hypothetical protein